MTKALNTRQKLMFRTDGQRPRNPVVTAPRKMPPGRAKAGAPAQRRAARKRADRV